MYRVAFFGTGGDLFSLKSFKVIRELQKSQPSLVGDLSLITRKLKPSGRGQKNIVIPEIVAYAKQESVDWHQIEEEQEFSGVSNRSNLAIAVSYGKLIPGSLIRSLHYGGLNVHPSLLPRYRGASPLQYAIMNQDKATGVSVQTLHPSKFDYGQILWQSPEIPLSERETTETLTEKLAPIGADGLVSVLHTNPTPLDSLPWKPSKAPLIPTSLHKIDFALSADELDARGRAIGKLYFDQKVEQKKTKSGKLKGHPVLRVNLKSFEKPASLDRDVPVGTIWKAEAANGTPILALKCQSGVLGAAEVTVQGYKTESAESYIAQFEKRKLGQIIVD